MVETTLSQLSGERVRYNKGTWVLTGDVSIRRNGEVLDVKAKEDSRGRGATLRFELENKPRSVNPGNLGNLSVDLMQDDGGPMVLVHRSNGTDRYRLDAMNYT